MRAAQYLGAELRHLLGSYHPAPDRILEVMVQIGHDIGNAHNSALKRTGHFLRVIRQDLSIAFGMFQNTVANFNRQIQPGTVVFKNLNDPQALLVVRKIG